MEGDFAWPDVRRSIFDMEGDSSAIRSACQIDWIDMAGFHYGAMSRQYRDAADALVEHVEKGRLGKHPEFVLFPVAYLYRHSLELMLKSLVEIISDSGAIQKQDLTKNHGLIRLWQTIKPELIKRWPNADRKPLNNVESLLNDFHKIDKTGQSLRYHVTKEGKDTRESLPRIIRLDLMKSAFGEMYALLDGCGYGFESDIA